MLESSNIQIKYEAQKAYSGLLRHIKDAAFNDKWASIFGYILSSVLDTKPYI
jgi:hypothetical protein